MGSQHPKYNANNSRDNKVDLSLLKLLYAAQISYTINVVCLPMDLSNLYIGEDLVVTGWGDIIYDGIESPVLRAAQLKGIKSFYIIY